MREKGLIILEKKTISIWHKGKNRVFQEEGRISIDSYPVPREKISPWLKKEIKYYVLLHPSLVLRRNLIFSHRPPSQEKKFLKFKVEESIPFSAEEIEIGFFRKKNKRSWEYVVYIIPPHIIETLQNIQSLTAGIKSVSLLPFFFYASLFQGRKKPSSVNSGFWIMMNYARVTRFIWAKPNLNLTALFVQ